MGLKQYLILTEGSLEVKLPMYAREKVEKSRFIMFFQWFVALEGRKLGLLKPQVRSCLWRWEMKTCTSLWHEAHFEPKSVKQTHGLRPLLEVEMLKQCTPLWREAHVEVQMCKAHHVRTTFGSSDVQKVHAVVARSTFPSQNVQSTSCLEHIWKLRCWKSARTYGAKHISKSKELKAEGSEHFWKLRCWKSAQRCAAKHISKSKWEKHHMPGPLLEVRMW